jgi:putative intracellular protease/amidase
MGTSRYGSGATIMAEPVDVSKKHFYISLVKSAVRIAGCVVAVATGSWGWLAAGLLVGELLGIAEEL